MVSIETLRNRAILLSLLIVVIGGLGWFLIVSDKDGSLFGENLRNGDLPIIDFNTLNITEDEYLYCPLEICTQSTPDGQSPIYDYNIAKLSRALFAYTDTNQAIQMRRRDLKAWQFDLSEYNQGQSFPDLITIKFIPQEPSGTTIAIYSRSVVGKGTKERHKERVERWIRFIEANL